MKKIKKHYFILIIFLCGLISGLCFVLFISDVDKLLIKTEVLEYLKLIKGGGTTVTSFFSSFFNYSLTYTIITFAGLFIIFLPINYFILYYKGFILGFLIVTLIKIYKIKGILYTFIFTFPHEIINLAIIVFLVIYTTKISKVIFKTFKDGDNYNLVKLLKKYFLLFFILIIIATILALIEVFINPFFLKLIA